MKSKIYIYTILFTFLLASLSCDDSNPGMQKNISGKAGEVLVVISKEAWEAAPGKLIKDLLTQPHISLPQEEPIFDLSNFPIEAFKPIFHNFRNIIKVSISQNVENEGIEYKDNVWAYPQATVHINAKTSVNFEKIFSENQEKILSYFLLAERKRLTSAYSKLYEKSVYNVLSEEYGVTMKVPPGFVIALKKKDFIWLKYETPAISQGILIHFYPYKSDSVFTTRFLVSLQDSVLKENVPLVVGKSYMQIEKRVEQVFNIFEHNKNYASEMRGLWEVKNDFMGGPYISLSELNLLDQKILTVFGYVYAPSKDKRNFLRQVEAMIYSVKFNNQTDIDKLNKQMNLEAGTSN